jgi:hypothetical protein
MKKLFISFLIIYPLITFSQKNEVEQNALKWFKSVYVENNFKDPYSFKLMKISSIPQNVFDYYKSDKILPFLIKIGRSKEYASVYDTTYLNTFINITKESVKSKGFSIEEKDKYYDDIDKAVECRNTMNLLANMSKENKNNLSRYAVYIDCYSNNSYGNKVLGRYAFFYYPNSSPFYEDDKKYSYKKFMIDENTIIQLNKD